MKIPYSFYLRALSLMFLSTMFKVFRPQGKASCKKYFTGSVNFLMKFEIGSKNCSPLFVKRTNNSCITEVDLNCNLCLD